MDNPQQLARTGALAAWVNAVLGLVLTVLIDVADQSVPVALIPALVWCVLGLGFAAFADRPGPPGHGRTSSRAIGGWLTR